jgi:hypothetical protein
MPYRKRPRWIACQSALLGAHLLEEQWIRRDSVFPLRFSPSWACRIRPLGLSKIEAAKACELTRDTGQSPLPTAVVTAGAVDVRVLVGSPRTARTTDQTRPAGICGPHAHVGGVTAGPSVVCCLVAHQ